VESLPDSTRKVGLKSSLSALNKVVDMFFQSRVESEWKITISVVFITTLFLGSLMIPATEQALKFIFSKSFGEESAAVAVSTVLKLLIVTECVFGGFLVLIRWGCISVLLYSLSKIIRSDVWFSFKRALTVAAYSECIFLLLSLLTVGVVYARGLGSITTPSDLVVFRGLDIILAHPTANPYLTTILQNLNPFSLGYVAALSKGLTTEEGSSRPDAVLVSLTAWSLWLCVQVGGKDIGTYALNVLG